MIPTETNDCRWTSTARSSPSPEKPAASDVPPLSGSSQTAPEFAIGDIDLGTLSATAQDLGITCFGELDVTNRNSFDAFLTTVEGELGPLDVLVNNAGIMPVGALHDEADAITRRMVEVNLLGVLYGSKLAVQRLLPRGHGHVINISSWLIFPPSRSGSASTSATSAGWCRSAESPSSNGDVCFASIRRTSTRGSPRTASTLMAERCLRSDPPQRRPWSWLA